MNLLLLAITFVCQSQSPYSQDLTVDEFWDTSQCWIGVYQQGFRGNGTSENDPAVFQRGINEFQVSFVALGNGEAERDIGVLATQVSGLDGLPATNVPVLLDVGQAIRYAVDGYPDVLASDGWYRHEQKTGSLAGKLYHPGWQNVTLPDGLWRLDVMGCGGFTQPRWILVPEPSGVGIYGGAWWMVFVMWGFVGRREK